MKQVLEGKLHAMPESWADSMEKRLWRLESLRAIEELVFQYTKCADLADGEGMAACFTSDGRLRWGPQGPAVKVGREELCAYFKKIVGASRTQQHFCTNFQILFHSAELAVGECNMFSWQIWKDAQRPATVCSGRYEFQAVVEDGEWRLSSLCLTLNVKLENGTIADGREGEQFFRPWPPCSIGEEDK